MQMVKINYLFFSFICYLFMSCSNHVVTNSCLLAVNDRYVYLYTEPGGEIHDSVCNNTKMDDYYVVSIKRKRNDYFYVEIEQCMGDIKKTGWVKKGTLSINPSTTSVIYLYKKPSYESGVKDSIMQPYWGDLYIIEDVEKDWFLIKGKDFNGWLSPMDQCSNPYTTCS